VEEAQIEHVALHDVFGLRRVGCRAHAMAGVLEAIAERAQDGLPVVDQKNPGGFFLGRFGHRSVSLGGDPDCFASMSHRRLVFSMPVAIRIRGGDCKTQSAARAIVPADRNITWLWPVGTSFETGAARRAPSAGANHSRSSIDEQISRRSVLD